MIMAQSFPAWAEEGMISGAAAETTANFKSISSGQVTMMSGCRCDRIKNYIVGAGGHRCPPDVDI